MQTVIAFLRFLNTSMKAAHLDSEGVECCMKKCFQGGINPRVGGNSVVRIQSVHLNVQFRFTLEQFGLE